MSMIEGLEGRIVFAASGVEAAAAKVIDDAAVAATVVKVQVDRAAVDVARDAVKQVATTGAAKVRAVATDGKTLIATDRAAVKASRDDDAALAAAREKLNADRQAIRTNLAAARDALKSDTAEARAELKQVVAELKTDLRQLRADVRAATAAERQKLRDDVTAVVDRSGISEDRVQAVVDQVTTVVNNAAPVDTETVRTLARTVADALDDGTLSEAEQDQIRSDARTVLTAANVSETEVRGIADDARTIIESANVSREDLQLIASDLRALFRAFVSAT